MGLLWAFTLSLAVASTSAGVGVTNSTACEADCWRCEQSAGGRGRCLALCPLNRGARSSCTPPKKLNELVVGGLVGLIVCIILAVCGLLCVRLRNRRRDSLPKQSPKALKNFHKDLDRFRPHAYTFLGILNNVRRQVREMHKAGNTDAAVICGRSLSDLAKILMLLNRRDVPVVPPDWPRLASWADRLLERTSLVNPPPQQQVQQLIQFLQAPPQSKPTENFENQSTMMSTLKPPAYEASIGTQDSLAFNDFAFKADWSQQWEFPQESVSERGVIQHADAWQSRHEVVQNNLWLDDDFLLLSFRPQDEIVTVL